MLEDRFFHSQHFIDYVHLLFDLHRAISEAWDETEAGEALRERMDEPGSRPSSDEIASASGIAADFYSLTDAPPVGISPVSADAVDRALEAVFQPGKSIDVPRCTRTREHARSIRPRQVWRTSGKMMEAGEHHDCRCIDSQRASAL